MNHTAHRPTAWNHQEEPMNEPITTTRRIYVASSWRCPDQQAVVQALRDAGHEVYDFRNPPEATGFAEWSTSWRSR